jgi:hypothetical protein
MIITDEEFLVFFEDKIECAVAQIKNRVKRLACGSYRINKIRTTEGFIWSLSLPQATLSIHPLDLILDGHKILYDKSKTDAVARRLSCNRKYIVSFNYGLRGELSAPQKTSMEYKFFMYGRKVRTRHAKKPLKKKKLEYAGD